MAPSVAPDIQGYDEPFQAIKLGTHQKVAYTSTAGTSSAIAAGVSLVRVVVTTAAYIKIGAAVTATSSDVYMPADSAEYFACDAGDVVSAIRVSADGNLHVTSAAGVVQT